jgi:hypothetical protein
MPTNIEMSPAFVTGFVTRMFGQSTRTTTTTASTTPLLTDFWGGGYPGAQPSILIMKGTPPADFSTLTSYSARSSDILVSFTKPGSPTGSNAAPFELSTTTVNPATIQTDYAAATASGTATWFWWIVRPASVLGVLSPSDALLQQITGTVGITGSGADLEIPDTTIVSGSPYRVLNFRLQFPTLW